MTSRSSPRKSLRAWAAGVFCLVLVMAASLAQAAATSVAIGFDADNNPECTLTLGSRTLRGLEVALTTAVTTTVSTGTVGAITRRTCIAGAFGPAVPVSPGGWPVGIAAGRSGSDLIETFLPLADLGGARALRIGAIIAAGSLSATNLFYLFAAAPGLAVPIPALSLTGLLLVLVGGSSWLMRRYTRQGG